MWHRARENACEQVTVVSGFTSKFHKYYTYIVNYDMTWHDMTWHDSWVQTIYSFTLLHVNLLEKYRNCFWPVTERSKRESFGHLIVDDVIMKMITNMELNEHLHRHVFFAVRFPLVLEQETWNSLHLVTWKLNSSKYRFQCNRT